MTWAGNLYDDEKCAKILKIADTLVFQSIFRGLKKRHLCENLNFVC